jgi:hypothetical protein
MPFTLYTASIPVFVRGMRNLASFLQKAQQDAVSRKFDPAILVEARLAPDMHKLSRQIQIASDMVKNGAARLAGVEAPSFPDTETNFDELQARIAKTIAYLETITEAQLDGAAERTITLKFPGREMTFSGADYLSGFVLPNLYFHMTTAYNILRHNGAPLGKADFIGG